MTPHQSDALLSRFLGNTLMDGSVRLVGAILLLSLAIAAAVYFL